MTQVESPLERLAAIPRDERNALLVAEAQKHGVSPREVKATLLRSWRFVGRPKQQEPPGDWMYWWILAGRGFGKTLTGAQWTKKRALERRCRFAVIAPTLGDVRRTCIEGETGILSVLPNAALLGQSRSIAWNKTLLELTLANGTIVSGFTSEEPDRLRGPQHDYVWGEEVSSWKDAHKPADQEDTTWSNMKLGLRLGEHPRACLTSTPKANRLTRDVLALPPSSLVVVKGSSYENRSNLSELWWNTVVAPLEGTRTGRQEILAELLDDVEGALWTRATIELCRVVAAPALSMIVVGVDPNTSSGEAANDAGVIVAGKGASDRHGYVLADRTVTRGGPAVWARAAVDAYHEFDADRVVAEANNGGEMVALTIKAVDPAVPVEIVHASRGKRTRAEPVATLYEREVDGEPAPQVHHVGAFPELEDEMCLPPWTMVETSRGFVAIEHVVAGDEVLTRNGWAPVEWAGPTGTASSLLEVAHLGGVVLCTPCHPLLLNREFAPASSALPGHLLDVRPSPAGTGLLSLGAADGGTEWSEATTATREASCSTAPYGSRTSARSRTGRERSSTTGTRTQETTSSRTSSSSPPPSTPPATTRDGSSGRSRPRSDHGDARRSGIDADLRRTPASTAAQSSSPSLLGRRSAVVSVSELALPAPIAVYNLKVAEGYSPEFYADGVLVHNCTWTPEAESPNRMDALVWAVTKLGLWTPVGRPMRAIVPKGRIPGIQDRR